MFLYIIMSNITAISSFLSLVNIQTHIHRNKHIMKPENMLDHSLLQQALQVFILFPHPSYLHPLLHPPTSIYNQKSILAFLVA